jgi:hypothetical protein
MGLFGGKMNVDLTVDGDGFQPGQSIAARVSVGGGGDDKLRAAHRAALPQHVLPRNDLVVGHGRAGRDEDVRRRRRRHRAGARRRPVDARRIRQLRLHADDPRGRPADRPEVGRLERPGDPRPTPRARPPRVRADHDPRAGDGLQLWTAFVPGLAQQFPFAITVPADAPPTFLAQHNQLRWTLRGVCDRSLRGDHDVSAEIVVYTAP